VSGRKTVRVADDADEYQNNSSYDRCYRHIKSEKVNNEKAKTHPAFSLSHDLSF